MPKLFQIAESPSLLDCASSVMLARCVHRGDQRTAHNKSTDHCQALGIPLTEKRVRKGVLITKTRNGRLVGVRALH